jgi:serine/threonine-protein kinase
MRAAPAIWALLAVLTVQAEAKDLRPFADERFGTAAAVPSDWTRLPPDERWHGVRFVSPDGSSWLAIYAARQDGSIEAHMDATMQADGENVTYLVRRRGWLVVSGQKGDRVFYRKAILACTVWHHIAIEYPARLQRTYEPLVSLVSRSLEAGSQPCG